MLANKEKKYKEELNKNISKWGSSNKIYKIVLSNDEIFVVNEKYDEKRNCRQSKIIITEFVRLGNWAKIIIN